MRRACMGLGLMGCASAGEGKGVWGRGDKPTSLSQKLSSIALIFLKLVFTNRDSLGI